MTLKVESTAIQPNGPIPTRYTEDGQDLSPPLSWSGVPDGARELALIVDDPDAPRADPWVHWVLYGLSASAASLPEGIPADARPAQLDGAVQGKNSWGTLGYRGPAPPKGHGVHHYHFKLYALDTATGLQPGAGKDALLAAMRGHIVAEGELVGTYERK